ncbi:MAG: hypothetical protein ACFCU3_04505 [Verrucomicrobiales bacterium]
MSLEELKDWADRALVSPLDKVSCDQATWIKAPMVPELHMDWLVEVSDHELYGPTTVGAIEQFLDADEIQNGTVLINCVDSQRLSVSQLQGRAFAKERSPIRDHEDETVGLEPKTARIRGHLQKRVRELENALLEERRYSQSLEENYRKLEARLHALLELDK